MTREMGKTLGDARAEVERAIEMVEAATAVPQTMQGRTLEGVATREGAEALRGLVLHAQRIEDDDVIWIDDLFGAELFDASGVSHGKVVDVEANPASDILVLDSGALVPLTFVTNVEANVRIDVDAPEGLFE